MALGAPEVTRMIRPNGTTSEVTQSIDTWSFGCVLSVAATWVVLGFQGVRQYEMLRKLSPANNNIHDRFHNGREVLQEVKKWHNYLRGHLRQSDTMTSMVLDLIEHKMLQTETNDRIGMRELCTRLNKLIKDANEEATHLEIHTRITDKLVLKALLALEEEAQALSSKPKANPLRRRSKGAEGSVMPNFSERESGPLPKDAAITSTPLGQTTFRKAILESELKGKSFIQGHEDDFTESPVDLHPPDFPHLGREITNHLRPIGSQHQRYRQDARLSTSPNFEQRGLPWSPTNGAHAVGPVQALPYGQNYPSSNAPHTPPPHVAQTSHSAESPITQTNILGSTPPQSAIIHHPVRRVNHGAPKWPPEGFEESLPTSTNNIPIITHTEDTPNQPASQFPEASAQGHARLSENLAQTSLIPSSHANSVPHIKPPTPPSSLPTAPHSDADLYSPVNPLSPASPSPTVTSYPGPSASKIPKIAHSSSFPDTGKQVVSSEEHIRLYYDELPQHVHDLPYPICHVRKELDEETPKGMRSKVKGIFHGEERKANTSLKKTYGNDRDIVSSLPTTPMTHLTLTRS
jgi:hypothetical protein